MSKESAVGSGESVLVVDDEKIIRLALCESLQLGGYNVTLAESPDEGLQRLEEKEFAVILSDQRMPGMSGLAFLEKAKAIQPDASRILITGVLTLKTVIDAINRGEIFRFLAKPWIREELLVAVANGAQRFRLLRANTRLREDLLQLNDELTSANRSLQEKVDELTERTDELHKAHRALEDNFDQSIETCQRMMGVFHKGLCEESHTVASLVEHMADVADLEESERKVLSTSARIYNIGLMGLPRDLIQRYRQQRSSLSEQELQMVHEHPIYAQTLASFVAHLEAVGQTIRSCRERWDGKGYPDRLRGEGIPRLARLLAVAVAYAESHRSQMETAEWIVSESGKAFDPDAVRIIVRATQRTKSPRKVREVTFSDLRPGMILADGIESSSGLPLVPAGTSVQPQMLRKLQDYKMVDPKRQKLRVYGNGG